MNKNGEITIDEKKSESSKEESNGVFQYIRELYEKYVGPGK